ncbi:zinc finger protein crol gamma [Colletotrichum plurivorum]|uniref:Zinc finger protein crol gamma n=1 Tax=Colletotrichum plurivorum TaxID=2175906 RepID=A0A8H6NPD6_9PEZI|nr:zinc finger protein crol gamma [Colletotrichum plurivorum]
MASDNGPIATEAPLLAATTPVASDAFALGGDPARTKSLKRARETTPTSPTSVVNPTADSAAAAAPPSFEFASPTKSARFALAAASRRSPTPLTAAAAIGALEEERKREQRLSAGSSDNPGHSVLSVLAGSVAAMSRPDDAPQAPTASMEASTKDPHPVSIPQSNNAPPENHDVSPQSATSAANIADALVTASPGPMDVDHKGNEQTQQLQQQPQPQPQPQPPAPQPSHPAPAQEEKPTPGSLSYPGSLQAAAMMPAPPARGMSYPMPSPGHDSPNQSSGKKHKCPFCETEFTRHHNLKSHLLTHSQEKPYICQECSMRFRRLHDLKRHSKLHTGEKPHICPKCDRKFARGDALARHSKGAGGCAGRRSSMGSFAETDDMDGPSMVEGDESMVGVVYGNEEDITEEERRLSLPSIKAQHVPGAQGMEGYNAHSRTYPPAGPRPGTTGGLYPPNVDRGASSTTTSPSMPNSIAGGHTPNTSVSSMPVSGGSMYSQSGMTESPKPLSPGAAHDTNNITRQRSPSLTQQFQQQQFGRRPSDRNTSPGPSYPSALDWSCSSHADLMLQAFVAPAAHAGAAPAGPAHARSASGAENGGNMFASDSGVWSYVHNLEEKVKALSEKVSILENGEAARQAQVGLLTNEVTWLKKQLEEREDEPTAAKA